MAGREAGSGREQLLQAALAYFAANGVHNQSLRSLAANIGTSHRMLNYHFGSREGLLTEVVAAVERRQREAYASLFRVDSDPAASPREMTALFWNRMVDETLTYGPLVFELASHAMQGEPHARILRQTLVAPWLDAMEDSLVRVGYDPGSARMQARLALAVVNGLLFDLLLTGDRAGASEAHGHFLDLIGLGDRTWPGSDGTGGAVLT
ncbi:helix-turn-helix domain-containing protein [Arthrobacter sp. zg-Y1219]|uniref:TetR/AcrR family transcriptional regulator n=1 Tax=Arthrobacter sp. zg-Y1219 TaxID=3049067 RepID=UPI0024C3B96C|nr:helix-turn-helix domain-containing protein [Arthrobacter sp. zg-Y1219]MDK1360832.1 helix-turn-helix domain-containing protein [Arthrobacter sp. zg-Y1219]